MHGLETIRKINDIAVAAMAESGVAVKAITTPAEQAELEDIAKFVTMLRNKTAFITYVEQNHIADYLVAAYGIQED